MPSEDPKAVAFGKAVAAERKAKGLLQKEVAARTELYSDERSYRRVESGDRTPERSNAIAILVRGLALTDLTRISELLAILEYEGLNETEIASLRPKAAVLETAAENPLQVHQGIVSSKHVTFIATAGFLILGLYLALAGDHAVYAVTTSGLYSGLYVISLFLESAYVPRDSGFGANAMAVFGFMFCTAAGAMRLDDALLKASNLYALPAAFAMFLFAAAAQWLFARRFLSPRAITEAKFQTLSAQTAHLKNTCYYLIVVVLFWLTPYHAIATARSLLQTGRLSEVHELTAHQIMIGSGVAALNAASLAAVLALILGISIYMGAHLLDNLKPHAALASFHTFFYARALLYFTLSLVCLGWYFSALGSLTSP